MYRTFKSDPLNVIDESISRDSVSCAGLLSPTEIDQNPWAQSRRPRYTMRQGWSVNLFEVL